MINFRTIVTFADVKTDPIKYKTTITIDELIDYLNSIDFETNVKFTALSKSQIKDYDTCTEIKSYINLSKNTLSKEAMDFLDNHNIDVNLFKSIKNNKVSSDVYINYGNNFKEVNINRLNDEILSLKSQTSANSFSDEQIKKYLIGLISYPTQIVGKNISQKMAIPRPFDEGIGYEVKSLNGYFQTTAFAKIPDAYRGNNDDTSAYMFWTLKDKIDIGIWYSSGVDGTGWRICWTRAGNNTESVSEPISGLYAGRNIYFNLEVINDQYATIKIFDANNFSNKICDYSIYIGGLNINRANNNFNRQITLCRDGANFTGGGYIRDARFWDAYIYNSNGYYKTTINNCVANNVGAFGTNAINVNMVNVDSTFTKQWYSEKVSIEF